ncbi:MAG TPA: RHS repeat-associated core domain-containing protein [Chthoniobacteraceae bacterium]|nr:RHS repeat-associated core domain-containing protein [Chthoniobacteraceae bacterium]
MTINAGYEAPEARHALRTLRVAWAARLHLGQTRFDYDSAVAEEISYDPMGKYTEVSGTTSGGFGFEAYHSRQQRGLNPPLFPTYPPLPARWISRDPLGERGGINLYGYVLGNPINYYDPNGENVVIVVVAVGLVAIIVWEDYIQPLLTQQAKDPDDCTTGDRQKTGHGTRDLGDLECLKCLYIEGIQ